MRSAIDSLTAAVLTGGGPASDSTSDGTVPPISAPDGTRDVFSRLRRYLLPIAVLAASLALAFELAGCDSGKPTHSQASKTPAPPLGAATGWLIAEPDRVEFIQWIDASGQLRGQVQLVYLPDGGSFAVLTQNYPFTGTHSGNDVSLSVDQSGHQSVTWTGSIAGDALVLISPATSGLLQTTTYHQSTVDAYNQATIAFKNSVRARSDVVGADSALTSALSKLHTDAAALATDTRFEAVTKGFDPNWSAVQAALQAEQSAGQQPFDCARSSEVGNQRSDVGRALVKLQSDDQALNAAAGKVSADIDAVNTGIATVKTDLQTLQTALNQPMASAVTARNSSAAVSSAMSDAQGQVDASQSAMRSAQDQYGGYLDKGTGADNQAAQLLASVSCPTPLPAIAVPAASGSYARISAPDGVNVRAQPGSPNRVGCLMQGAVIQLTDGPRSAAGIQWYYARDFGWISSDYLQQTSPPSADDSSPEGAVRGYYYAIDSHNLARAWSLTSRGFQAARGNDFTRWSHGFDTTRSVILEQVQPRGTSVGVVFVSVDAGPVVNRWGSSWTAVQESGRWRLERSDPSARLELCGSAAQPSQPSQQVSVNSVAGTWVFTDVVRYGVGTGQSFTFRVVLTQEGAQVLGSGDAFSLSGVLNGRTLHATYGSDSHNTFTWTFAQDGSSFQGTYTNSNGNGGDSSGQRAY